MQELYIAAWLIPHPSGYFGKTGLSRLPDFVETPKALDIMSVWDAMNGKQAKQRSAEQRQEWREIMDEKKRRHPGKPCPIVKEAASKLEAHVKDGQKKHSKGRSKKDRGAAR
eukprot:3165366-Amphidinium_carterae.1